MPCYLNSDKLLLTLSDRYHSPEQDSNLFPTFRILVSLTTQPPRPDWKWVYFHMKKTVLACIQIKGLPSQSLVLGHVFLQKSSLGFVSFEKFILLFFFISGF